MRKLLFVAGILLCSLSIMAQNISLTTMKKTWGTTAPTGATFDTIKTTTPIYLYTGPITGYKDAVNITAVATEISGTTSGTVTLQVSDDGINWSPYQKTSADTLTLADVTTAQVFRWKVLNPSDKYYRVVGLGGGTVSVLLTAKYSAALLKQ